MLRTYNRRDRKPHDNSEAESTQSSSKASLDIGTPPNRSPTERVAPIMAKPRSKVLTGIVSESDTVEQPHPTLQVRKNRSRRMTLQRLPSKERDDHTKVKKNYIIRSVRAGQPSEVEYRMPIGYDGDGNAIVNDMYNVGLDHGVVCDGAFVSGVLWSENPTYLDLGEDFVPIFNHETGICDIFLDNLYLKKQQKGVTKLLPMALLVEVQPQKLVGSTVAAKWDNQTRPCVLIEQVNYDASFRVGWLAEQNHACVTAVSNISVTRLLTLTKKGKRQRYVIKSDCPPAEFLMTKNGKAVSKLKNHGTIDGGMIVIGNTIKLGGEEYLDLGKGKVPTGPTKVGKQSPKTRKLLPMATVSLLEPRSLVGFKIRGLWPNGNMYSDISIEKCCNTSTFEARRLSAVGLASKSESGFNDCFNISDIVQVLQPLEERKRAFGVSRNRTRRKSNRPKVFDVTFTTQSLGLFFTPHGTHGLPSIRKNQNASGNRNPIVDDVVVAVNGQNLHEFDDPYRSLFQLAAPSAGRPITLTFRRESPGSANTLKGDLSRQSPHIRKESNPAHSQTIDIRISAEKSKVPAAAATACASTAADLVTTQDLVYGGDDDHGIDIGEYDDINADEDEVIELIDRAGLSAEEEEAVIDAISSDQGHVDLDKLTAILESNRIMREFEAARIRQLTLVKSDDGNIDVELNVNAAINLWKHLDVDGDGEVTSEEFCEVMTRKLGPLSRPSDQLKRVYETIKDRMNAAMESARLKLEKEMDLERAQMKAEDEEMARLMADLREEAQSRIERIEEARLRAEEEIDVRLKAEQQAALEVARWKDSAKKGSGNRWRSSQLSHTDSNTSSGWFGDFSGGLDVLNNTLVTAFGNENGNVSVLYASENFKKPAIDEDDHHPKSTNADDESVGSVSSDDYSL